jgi:hypothetical protein
MEGPVHISLDLINKHEAELVLWGEEESGYMQ